MSESEDVDMTGAARGGPPVGVTPGGQSSDAGQRAEGQTAAPKAPPKALVTKEMLASVRPKSPPNPPRSPRVSSPHPEHRLLIVINRNQCFFIDIDLRCFY